MINFFYYVMAFVLLSNEILPTFSLFLFSSKINGIMKSAVWYFSDSYHVALFKTENVIVIVYCLCLYVWPRPCVSSVRTFPSVTSPRDIDRVSLGESSTGIRSDSWPWLMFQVTSQDRKSDMLHRLSYQDKLLKLQSVGSWQNGRTLSQIHVKSVAAWTRIQQIG